MRTTLDLPVELLEEALKVSHCTTKTQVITVALEQLIRRSRVQDLKQFKGAVDLSLDLDASRKR
jgi:hypothetical protein